MVVVGLRGGSFDEGLIMGLEDLLAISGDDAATVVLRLIWTVMRGSWVLAILARDSCGLLPIERRLPRIGSQLD